MRIVLPILVVCAMTFIACQQETNEKLRTPKGYEIIFHEGPSDEKVQAGSFVYIDFFATSADTPLMPNSMEQEVRIPRGNLKRDVIGGISMMGVGDSATIIIPRDSLDPRALMNPLIKENINYHIKVLRQVDSATYMKQRMEKQMALMIQGQLADSVLKESLELYKSNKLANDLKTLESGLQVHILDQGSGSKINAGDQITVNYIGILKKDGTSFDSSYKREGGFPLTVGVGQVIKGWDEGLQQFNKGGEGILYIPSELGYGEQGSGASIGPNEDLVFYINIDE